MDTLSKILEILTNKFSLPVAILCAFLLYAPDSLLAKFDLAAFASSTRETIVLIFLFSMLLYAYEKAKKAFQYFKTKLGAGIKRRQRRKAIFVSLERLKADEEAWIHFCLRDNVRTVYATETKSTAIALEGKRLVYRPSRVYDRLNTPFTFYPEVWEYLTKNKDKYCPPDRINDDQYNQKVDDFVAKLRSAV